MQWKGKGGRVDGVEPDVEIVRGVQNEIIHILDFQSPYEVVGSDAIRSIMLPVPMIFKLALTLTTSWHVS